MTNALARSSGLPRLVRAIALASVLTVLGAAAAVAAPADDAYLRGYATALLEQTLGLRAPAISVDGGVVRLSASAIGATDRGRVLTALQRIPGVTGVEIVDTPLVGGGGRRPSRG